MSINNSNTSYLLICQWDGTESLLRFKERLLSEFMAGQHVEILFFTEIKRPKEGFEIPSRTYVIAKNDFSIFGKVKSKKMLPTEYTHYDVCLIFMEFNKKQDKLVKNLAIKHKVAFGYEREYVNINLIAEKEQLTEKTKFALQLLSKISD